MPETFEAIVIGGGPAGSSFALSAARSRKKVAILEKDEIPGRKVCGGVLSPKCRKYIDQLDLWDKVSKLPCQTLSGMIVEHESAKHALIEFPLQSVPTTVVDRALLDEALWNSAGLAGARCLQNAKAKEIHFKNGQWIIKIQHGAEEEIYASRFLVGADGRNSFVGQQLGVKVHRNGKSICFQYRLKNHSFEHNLLHFYIFEKGYCGLSVDGNGIAHLDVISMEGGESDVMLLDRVFQKTGIFIEKLKQAEFMEERPLARSPIGSGWREHPKQQSAFLLGDAQAWFEPFTGEGITLAIESGMKHARLLDQSVVVAPRIYPNISASNRLIAQLLKSSTAVKSFISIINYVPSISRLMARDVLL